MYSYRDGSSAGAVLRADRDACDNFSSEVHIIGHCVITHIPGYTLFEFECQLAHVSLFKKEREDQLTSSCLSVTKGQFTLDSVSYHSTIHNQQTHIFEYSVTTVSTHICSKLKFPGTPFTTVRLASDFLILAWWNMNGSSCSVMMLLTIAAFSSSSKAVIPPVLLDTVAHC